jgi:predicted cupin superfamily sugar epimerase
MTEDRDAPLTGQVAYRGLNELTAEQVVERLQLLPHREGGFFREVYRSQIPIETPAGRRPLSTVILYLLTPENPSRFHRLRFDEVWLYHAGAPAEMVLLEHEAGAVDIQVLGLDSPQVVVPGRSWMGARVLTEGQADWGGGRAPERRWTPDRRANPDTRWTLVSCVVSPGFDYADFEPGRKEELLRRFPQARRMIVDLT